MKRNKLIGLIVMMCVAAICLTLFVGCKGPSLDAPQGVKYDSLLFSWEAVEGADGYMVNLNGGTDFYTSSTFVSVNNSHFSGGFVDRQANALYIKAVTVDSDGNVKASSSVVKFEFDYVTPVETKWIVTLDLNYTNAPQAKTVVVKNDQDFDKPADPQRSGWEFAGWYRDDQCLVAAEFTEAGKSDFKVTADTTLYAKWTSNISASTSTIYFYSETWTEVVAKPYKGETALFENNGVQMAAVAGKLGWFKAIIDDTATSIIFTNGKQSTESLTFDKSKPYYKDGEWTATMPVEQPVEEEHSVFIKVNDDEPQELTENPKVEGEFMITLTLQADDQVVITMDGKPVANYDVDCKFTGTATVEGEYSFYVTAERIWVETPNSLGDDPHPDYQVYIIINDDDANKVTLTFNNNITSQGVKEEYFGTVMLAIGDKVVVQDSDGKTFTWYQEDSAFRGTVKVAGSHTFYVKIWEDGGDSMWVMAPKNTEVPTTSIKVYFHDSVAGNKLGSVNIYYWNYSTSKNEHTWPGVKMTALGDDWYVYEIEAGYDMVIFNNKVGDIGKQTKDLDLEVVDGCAYYDFNGVTSDRPADEEA